MKSLIRNILLEAEDLSLPKEDTADAEVAGEPMSGGDFAPAGAPTPAAASVLGSSQPVPPMPTVTPGNNTIQKEIVDKERILLELGGIKTLVTDQIKAFESEDFTVDSAKKRIDFILTELASKATALETLVHGETEVPEAEEEPLPEPMPEEEPAPSAEPEQGETTPPMPGQEGINPEDSSGPKLNLPGGKEEYNPYGPPPEQSEYTNPSEAI